MLINTNIGTLLFLYILHIPKKTKAIKQNYLFLNYKTIHNHFSVINIILLFLFQHF